jgi:molybdopterin/thiamine biosynthesis adenylyltransferase
VLLCGLGGLGVEIAKNILLMGVAHLTIHDPVNAVLSDLSSQFYLTRESVGKNRAQESLQKLKELNERVQIAIHNEAITEDFLRGTLLLTLLLRFCCMFTALV